MYNEDIGENQFSPAEIYASRHPLFPPARHVLFHLRPVSDRNDRNTRQGVADDGVPEPRIAGGTQGKDIEVISSHIEFNRKTDNKGRPVTNVIGGRITITVESTRETTILEAMVNSPFKAISGKVIYYNTKDNSIFRVVEFKYAYIVYYKEVYNVDRKRQMYSTITFSADIIMIGDAYLSNQW